MTSRCCIMGEPKRLPSISNMIPWRELAKGSVTYLDVTMARLLEPYRTRLLKDLMVEGQDWQMASRASGEKAPSFSLMAKTGDFTGLYATTC